MGVITCTAPMNPTGDVTYTHKKFKRATSEAYDTADQQRPQHQQQPHHQQQQQPLQPQQKPVQPQQRDTGKHDKTEIVEASTRPTTITVSVQPPLNGHLPAQLNCQLNSNIGGQLSSSDGDEVKKKNNGNSGGKYKCEYCGVGCAKPSVLDKHVRTHTNERPYSCDQCGIAFKTKSNYLKHTKSRAHALRCDGVVQDGGDGLIESSDCVDADRGESPRCPTWEGAGGPQIQHQPADLSVARPASRDPQRDDSLSSTAQKLHQEELSKDRGKSLYKPKFRAQYSLQDESSLMKGHAPPLLKHQPTPPNDASHFECNAVHPVTYQTPNSASNSNSRSSPSRHTASPAHFIKQCLPPLDIRAAAAVTAIKKEDPALPGQRSSVATPQSANSLWKGMKSPSPELLGQHITKLIVENQAIVETSNPLWSRRFRRQSSLGSSSSESDGSGSGKSRRCSLVDTSNKNSKLAAAGPPVSYSPVQSHPRERSHSLTGEALMIDPQSSYSPSLPPNPHLPLAQPSVPFMSASKPSISSHGPTTSYSQSDPAFATSHMGIHDLDLLEGPRKRSSSEGLGIARDFAKSRLHQKNPEGSVIKNRLLTVRAGITGVIDQNLERLEHERISSQSTVLAEVGPYMCTWCRTRCHSPENLEYHLRHYCGHRHAGSGSEGGTPDSNKSGDGGRWLLEQDVALDLQKKDRIDQYDHERSSSRGSSVSVGDASQRRGSDEDIRHRLDLSPRVYGSESTCDGASPPTKKRKMSEPESANSDKNMFLSPIFSPKGQLVCKNESAMKIADEMSKHKPSSRHFFGGEVQICDGKNLKTMRIDPSQQPSPTLDICIPPQQLGGGIPRSEVSVPTSVVVTIAKSGLNSGGTMVQVESQMSTASTKTVPSLVNSLLPQGQPHGQPHDHSVHSQNKVKTPIHHSNLYQTNPSQFQFSPSFLQYAPPLRLPNLTIPGIPTPDLRDLPYPMNPPNMSSQPIIHGHSPMPPKQNSLHLSVVPSRVSPLTLPQASAGGPSGGSASSFVSVPAGLSVHSTHVGAAHIGPPPPSILMRDKEKEHHKMTSKLQSASYPALIPIGNEKVPYVPGIPGPYSQAGSVVQLPSHSTQKSPMGVCAPSVSMPSVSPATTKAVNCAPSIAPVLGSETKEKHPSIPKPKDFPREPQRNPVKDVMHLSNSTKSSPKIMSHMAPKDIHVQLDRPRLPIPHVIAPEAKSSNPEIRIHPAISAPFLHQEKKDIEKKQIPIETQNGESSSKEGSSNTKDFLPPIKRPNSLALKPQPYTPKSVSLIGTTLVSPDTPRPKKSCVQMLLNGSAYTYLGHKVSTKSYFCCIYRQQPMYVPQSTDPKLSMYSNWQIRKPAEDNPLELNPYQSLGLYQSRKYNHAYTIAKEKELNLIQTHSSYWTFKEEKEKNKEKEEVKLKADEEDSRGGGLVAKVCENNATVAETSGPSIKREPDDLSDDSSYKTDEADGFDGSSKRVKIFEGGFKSSEDYTYVRGRGRGRYVCGTCGIRCKKPSMLKKHIRTHTDLRPYACGHCSFSFKTKGNLTKHLRSKAHYKRCVEMGIDPVPTVVDDSHVNKEALALQGKMEQERIDDEEEEEEEEDDDDDDDDDVDEDEDDDEAMDEDQFEDANDLKGQEASYDKDKESRLIKEAKDARDIAVSTASVSRAGVLVMMPSVSSNSLGSSSGVAFGSSEEKGSKTISNVDSSSRDSPMDLSVKKIPVPTKSPAHDKGTSPKKLTVPMRPNFLPIMSKSSVTDLRSPVGSMTSPGTPSTPIREHPSEILSPVTESSSLLKSIYSTTLRISSVSSGDSQTIVPDPTKENGCNSSMLQAYLKERAVLDTTIKRQQYKSSSSETSPDSPQSNMVQMSSDAVLSQDHEMVELPRKLENDSSDNAKVSVEGSKKDGKCDITSQASSVEQNLSSTPSPLCSSAVVNSSMSQVMTSRMPTPPANLTVMNSVGIDTKTAFLVPSGVVPSSLNRLGNDDGKCKCSICHKEFNKQSQLSIHMNIHYMERPYRCDSCAVSFRTNGHLQKHKRSLSHFNKVNMNMTFGTPSTDNPRPFKCHDCKIAFRIHGHLAKHLRSKMHIMKLECLGKLPFGTYAEIERSGANLNEIDTTDCDNSLESLQSMASRLYEKEPSKLAAWQDQQERLQHRVRTVSNSSTNSDDYPLQDEQDDPLTGCGNDEDTEGDDDEELPVPPESGRISVPGTVLGPLSRESHSPQPNTLQTIEVGSQQLTPHGVQTYTCGLCEASFSSHSQLMIHSQHHCSSSGIVGLKSS